MRRRYWIAGLALLLLLAAGWAWFSPGWTLAAMARAAEANDADALSAYVDYEALRRDLKADLGARLKAEARKENGPAAPLGLAIGEAMMGPVVDAIASPRGMRTTFAAMKRAGDAEGMRRDGEAGGFEPEIERRGLSGFLVRDPASSGSALVFERRGLGWKLVGIELPAADR